MDKMIAGTKIWYLILLWSVEVAGKRMSETPSMVRVSPRTSTVLSPFSESMNCFAVAIFEGLNISQNMPGRFIGLFSAKVMVSGSYLNLFSETFVLDRTVA